jgi:hypothetical protein
VDVATDDKSAAATAARKVARLLGDLETYVSGQANIIIDYATARRREEPISTAITESTVQWLLHRRMNAQQQMRWSPRGAHLMLKVRIPLILISHSGFFRAFGAEDAGPIQQDAVEGIMPRQEHDAGGGRIWHDHTWSASAA